MTDFDALLSALRGAAAASEAQHQLQHARASEVQRAGEAQIARERAVWRSEMQWFIAHARKADRPPEPLRMRVGKKSLFGRGWRSKVAITSVLGWSVEIARSWDSDYGDRGPLYVLISTDARSYQVEDVNGRSMYCPPMRLWIPEPGMNMHMLPGIAPVSDLHCYPGKLVAEVASWS